MIPSTDTLTTQPLRVVEVSMGLQGRLVILSGKQRGAVYSLGSDPFTLGRGTDCDVMTESDYASRHHAEIFWDGGRYLVRDLGSKNGTQVNGRPVVGDQPLSHGDELSLPGLSASFRATEETLTQPREAWTDARIEIRTESAEVLVDGSVVHVTAKEFLALCLFAERAGLLVRKDDLATHVWPEFGGVVSDDSIEQLISRLRRKLEADPEHPRHITTIRGLGYVFSPRG